MIPLKNEQNKNYIGNKMCYVNVLLVVSTSEKPPLLRHFMKNKNLGKSLRTLI